jgi:leucyl aminopeptidase (aminopeptidase T)
MSSPFKQRFTSKSPLKQGAYESAADNDVYLSTQPQMQQVQNALAKIGVAAAGALNDPKKKAERQEKRVARRNKRALKKNEKWKATDDTEFNKKTKEIVGRAAKNKIEAAEKRKRKPIYDKAGNIISYGKKEPNHFVDWGKYESDSGDDWI